MKVMERLKTGSARWLRFFEVTMPYSLLPVAVGMAMAWRPGVGAAFWGRSVLVTLLMFLGLMFVHGSDSIVGYRRGVDQQVYKRQGVVKREKPLVTGEVSMREAVIATSIVLALLLAVCACYVLMTGWRVSALTLGSVFILTQYSVGLRLSYRGLGELAVAGTGMGAPIAYGFLTGSLAVAPLLVGVVLGLWQGAANVASNHADYQDDRAAGRKTLAVRLGLTWHRRVGVLMLVLGWGLLASLIVLGALPAAMALVAVLGIRHVRQVQLLYAGEILKSRRLGFETFYKLSLGMAVVMVLAR
ncbi:prenyltransferase [Archangium sp.]|uniref:prenyltransferase n=1 Tax=Archangium sp. TaxID=1872627 RepID=UPI00389AA9DE